MKLYVIREIQVKKSGKIFRVAPGAIVEIRDPRKAETLIESGHVRPILPPDEAGKIQAVRIWSKILEDEVWVVTHPEAIAFVPEGEVYYLPEEIRNLRGASPEEIQAVHRVKRELGGCLVSVKERKGVA